jgi:low temperature requirement protein LtrA
VRSALLDFLASMREPLSIYDAEDRTRHATWLELFFDLVFIVAIAELGRLLRETSSVVGILEYAALFLIVWWAWVGFSYYADVFETNDLFTQLALVLVMFVVLVTSQTIHGALHGGSFAFAAAFLFLRLCYIGLTARGWYLVARDDAFFSYWVTFSALSTAVWALSLLYPAPERFGLWISAFLLEIAGIGIVYLVFDSIPVQVSHFPERLGLFTILVLGETILAVAAGTEQPDWFVRSGVTALGGFLIAVTMWWLYFNHFDERTIDRVLAAAAGDWLKMRERMLIYVFGHYFVYTGIGLAGVGIESILEAATFDHTVDPFSRLLLDVGIAAFLLGSGVCHRVMPTPLHDHLFVGRIVTAGIVLGTSLVGSAMAPVVTTWTVAIVLGGLTFVEAVYRHASESATPIEPE